MARRAPIVITPPHGSGGGMPRREFLRALARAGAGGLAIALARPWPVSASAGPRAGEADGTPFPDGVKSGDPQPRGGVIWTRVAPPPGGEPVEVVWSVATDAAMQDVVAGGTVWATAATGHAVHVAVRRLRPDHWYHYRFESAGGATPVGRLRTAPRPGAPADRLRYAFASCQQRTESHYVAHRAISREGVDFFMHLGDYVYVSDGGTLTLDDYRGVWRRFHSNPLLQELHAAVPLVAMWDDGEFYNGVDRTGPAERLANARTAWFEAMPFVRTPDDHVYRSFRWGRLAEVLMIDVRSYRDPEVAANSRFFDVIDAQDTTIPPGEQMFAPGRTTLGREQKRWLERRLRGTRATWRLIGNPYNMNPWKFVDYDTPALRAQNPNLQRNGGLYVSNEAWDDYAAERRELLDFLDRHRIPNVIFSSGHTHFYLACDLQPDYDDPAARTVAVDFVSGSLTADPDPRTIAPEDILHVAETLMLQANDPYMRYVNLLDQGYVLVDVTPEETIVDFRVIDTYDPAAEARTAARFRVREGRPGIEVLPHARPPA
jgi:alkaline phosphatase D